MLYMLPPSIFQKTTLSKSNGAKSGLSRFTPSMGRSGPPSFFNQQIKIRCRRLFDCIALACMIAYKKSQFKCRSNSRVLNVFPQVSRFTPSKPVVLMFLIVFVNEFTLNMVSELSLPPEKIYRWIVFSETSVPPNRKAGIRILTWTMRRS